MKSRSELITDDMFVQKTNSIVEEARTMRLALQGSHRSCELELPYLHVGSTAVRTGECFMKFLARRWQVLIRNSYRVRSCIVNPIDSEYFHTLLPNSDN